tara:strand:- start:417 stop:665 length:249 start_codon:yes stop_codon:yes gene_type:complete
MAKPKGILCINAVYNLARPLHRGFGRQVLGNELKKAVTDRKTALMMFDILRALLAPYTDTPLGLGILRALGLKIVRLLPKLH